MLMSDEVILYVARTSKGAKIEYRNYTGLSDGLFSKGYTRYFYGDESLSKALESARRKANHFDNYDVKIANNISMEERGNA